MIEPHVKRCSLAALALQAAFLAGCASLDPSAELDQTSALVTERTGMSPGWETPWSEPSTHWDGRTDLSSDDAARVALQNNRAIRRQVETIVASRAEYVQAHLLPNPIINVALGFPIDGLGGDPLLAAAVQELTWLWRRPAMIDGAEARLRAQILEVSDDALRLVAETRQAHAAVVFAERSERLQRDNIELIARSLDLVRDRFSVGEASRLDVNRVELDLRQAEVRLTDREMGLDHAKRRLLEVLGRADAGTDFSTDDGVPTGDHGDELAEQQVIELASAQRLDVIAAAANVEGRTAGLDLAERGRIPDLSAGVGYQQNFENRDGVFPSVKVTPKLLDDNSARIALADSELRQAVIEADRIRQAAVTEVRLAWIALRSQQQVVRAYQNEIIALAVHNLELARLAFDAGEADLTVLLEAQRHRNDATIALTDRQLAMTDRAIELERAAGGTLEHLPAVDITIAAAAPSASPGEPHEEDHP